MSTLSLLGQFTVVSMLMQIKQSMHNIPCLVQENESTEDTLEFLCERLADIGWISRRYQSIEDSSALPDGPSAALSDVLKRYIGDVQIPWSGDGAHFTNSTLQACLSQLPKPELFAYLNGTGIYTDTLQCVTFGSLYGDVKERTVAFLRLGAKFERWDNLLLEISSFIAGKLIAISVCDHPYAADSWIVTTLDTTATPVTIEPIASYCANGEDNEEQ